MHMFIKFHLVECRILIHGLISPEDTVKFIYAVLEGLKIYGFFWMESLMTREGVLFFLIVLLFYAIKWEIFIQLILSIGTL